ncbi:MAG: polyprenyl synthetase family protein [Verrucomicrobia bacterium]|nr:polyprenyl synthetase family protein [Verrucomicrobiota bacterium]
MPARQQEETAKPALRIPKRVVQFRTRPPGPRIPPTPQDRTRILLQARRYAAEFCPSPPLPLPELMACAERVLQLAGQSPAYRDFAAVVLHNELWRETLAGIPFERRLLLLPKCLRPEGKCPAPIDEFGLLCKQCGLCPIQDLQAEAERLGYAVLVAEGTQVVTSLLESGKIDAVVGVSCLNVLEKAFPYLESAAIPGVAIPLLQEDCANTTVDLDWVWDYLELTSEDRTWRMDLPALKKRVRSWFAPETLEAVMGPPQGQAERLAREWLLREGKRWRPFLLTAVRQALSENPEAPPPESVRPIAVAIECFHKASLIHDDIEDGDESRYGRKTFHVEQGVPSALNAGDLLIGEGYRLLAEAPLRQEQRLAMLQAAACAHRRLCRGQGADLEWAARPRPLTSREALEIFRSKTAPAFEAALRLGALAAGLKEEAAVTATLRRYSEALGIAYQIRDDLEDFAAGAADSDLAGARPGLIAAILWERADAAQRRAIEACWRAPAKQRAAFLPQMRELAERLEAEPQARRLLETYKEEAILALRDLENPNLKGLLLRTVARIFNDPETGGWCSRFDRRAAKGAESR